jgi:subtilisin family serine protease
MLTKQTPTKEYQTLLYPKFGVSNYHDNGFLGRGIKIYIIDTGLTNSKLPNAINRTPKNVMGSTKTHGNFVADILGSPQRNGLSGIAPEAEIYLNDVSDSQGIIYTSALVKAIKDASSLNVDILSISLGTSVYDESLESSIQEAAKKGILIFAASGNCSCRTYEFPSSCENAISVASMDFLLRPSSFNTRNDSVAVFAPGQNITVPGSAKKLSGTSFAVPFASGVAALELQRFRSDPKNKTSFISRDVMIAHLRDTFGHDCNTHSYSNDICTGRFMGGAFLAPSSSTYYLWPLVLLLGFSTMFLLAR